MQMNNTVSHMQLYEIFHYSQNRFVLFSFSKKGITLTKNGIDCTTINRQTHTAFLFCSLQV